MNITFLLFSVLFLWMEHTEKKKENFFFFFFGMLIFQCNVDTQIKHESFCGKKNIEKKDIFVVVTLTFLCIRWGLETNRRGYFKSIFIMPESKEETKKKITENFYHKLLV